MKRESKLVKAYTGTELTVMLLKTELEKAGIASVIRNDFQSGIRAGFSGRVPSAIDLYIQESDRDEATEVIELLVQTNG